MKKVLFLGVLLALLTVEFNMECIFRCNRLVYGKSRFGN